MIALQLLKWELFKLARRRASYVGFALCVLFCIAVMAGFAFSDFNGMRSYADSLKEDPTSYVNGYFFANFCINISFFSLLPLFAAVVPGSEIAGEAKEGTLRALLVRPPSRPLIFATKALASYLWLLFQIWFLVLFAMVLGLIAIGGGDFLVFIWEFRDQGGPWLAVHHPVVILLLAATAASVSLFTVAALALCLSALTDNPAVAHVGTLGVFFISSIIQRLPDGMIGNGFKMKLPTIHMGWWHESYQWFNPSTTVGVDPERLFHDLKFTCGYTIVFLAIGMVAFCRKDITS